MPAGHRRIRQTASPGVEAGTDGEAVAEKGSGRARPGSRGSISVPTQADGGHRRPTRVTAVGFVVLRSVGGRLGLLTNQLL
jgi:hypothetical protein